MTVGSSVKIDKAAAGVGVELMHLPKACRCMDMPVEIVNLPFVALERDLRSDRRHSIWKYRRHQGFLKPFRETDLILRHRNLRLIDEKLRRLFALPPCPGQSSLDLPLALAVVPTKWQVEA